MESNKLNLASLAGASILLKQMLEQDLLTHDEADAVMRKMIRDNVFSETRQSFLIHHIHGEIIISEKHPEAERKVNIATMELAGYKHT